jgi:hypothetical protein
MTKDGLADQRDGLADQRDELADQLASIHVLRELNRIAAQNDLVALITDAVALVEMYPVPGIQHMLVPILSKVRHPAYFWRIMTQLPDYNLQCFLTRMWPYFEVEARESKDWKESATGYAARTKDPEVDPYYNNFTSHAAIPPKQYVDVDSICNALITLHRFDALSCEKLALTLMMRPDTCHIIKANGFRGLFPFDFDGARMYQYGMYYALNVLRHEETVLFSKITVKHRSVFAHEAALRIPKGHGVITEDPHIQQLTSTKRVASTMPFYLNGPRRLTTSAEFERRFQLATGGCLAGVNLASMNAAVSGSILIPCVSISPLEDNFRGGDIQPDADSEFLAYLSYYYPGYESLPDPARKKALAPPKPKPVDFDKKEVETNDGFNTLADIDISVTVSSGDEFTDIAHRIFAQIQANCADPVYLFRKETLTSFKFHISGPGLTRPIDLFQVFYPPARMTKKFHMPCVRMWYEGTPGDQAKGLYFHRSALSALLSGVNEGYGWYSCNKIPAEVALKYAMRGITVILNERERSTLEAFMKKSERWSWASNIFGGVTRFHPVFSNSKGIRSGLRDIQVGVEQNDVHAIVNCTPTVTDYGTLTPKHECAVIPPNTDLIARYFEWRSQ